MDYITTEQLAELPGARELAQVASPAHRPVVDSELMEATLRNEDRTAWEPEEIADADDALERITGAVEQAESLINGFLAQRRYTLPLNPVPGLVTGWTRDIARYYLHKDRISSEGTDPIVRAYNDAMKLLGLIEQGKFSLGADDQLLNSPDFLDVRFDSDSKVFSRDQLKGFR